MNNEEIQSLVKQLKAFGLDDEKIMDTFYEAFTSGKMDRKDLEALSEAMGYELTDDFKNDPTPDPIVSEGAGDLSKDDLEDAKEIEPGESKEEFKEKIDDIKEDEPEMKEESTDEEVAENPEEPEVDEDDDEDKDWEEAQKMFKI